MEEQLQLWDVDAVTNASASRLSVTVETSIPPDDTCVSFTPESRLVSVLAC